jgi:uncharacterized membrane protein HdeD (DUF308 family)/alpha-beta hydrolase superfamily lysophospholipase
VWLAAALGVILGIRSLFARRWWTAGASISAGIVAAWWPAITIVALSLMIGAALCTSGALRVIGSHPAAASDRPTALLSGMARVLFGILALMWLDVTALLVGYLFGPALVLFGLIRILSATRRTGHVSRTVPKWLRVAASSLALACAAALSLTSVWIIRGSPSPDPFYSRPRDVPARPGVLLRSEPFTRGIPSTARAWRILYTTTRADGVPALASGIVVVSKTMPAGPRPAIAWAHGTTGFVSKCAPSLLAKGLEAGALPALEQVIARGWALVATDYVGLGPSGVHPYLIGEPEARSVLDAVRSAAQLDGIQLEKRTVVWGHSQGGGAALWVGIVAPRYAPDVNVVGIAALSPASEIPAIFDAVRDTPVGKIMGAYVVSAYAANYPDVHFDDYIAPEARLLARRTAARALSGPEALVSILTSLGKESFYSRSPASGALGMRLAENVPAERITAPLMIAQGLADQLVLSDLQARYVARLCASGQSLEYRTYAGFDHVGIVLDVASPLAADLVAWTQDRFDGKPIATGCRTVRVGGKP